jgi:diacylglycerol kinase (ATP)
VAKRNGRGLKRVWSALLCSFKGLRAAWRHEFAFRQEILLFVVGGPLGWWLGRDAAERALLIGSLVLVLVVELLNSAIEAAIDRIGEEEHPLSARAKDLGSAAVLGSLVVAAVVWGIMLLDRVNQ